MLVLPVYASEISGTVNTGNSITTGVNGIVMEAPTANPSAGAYTSVQNVVLSGGDGTASIHYTTNGSSANCATGNIYSAPIQVTSSLSINAISCYANNKPSPTISFAYVINLPSSPSSSGSVSSGGGGGTVGDNTTAPTDTSVIINNGAATTTSTTVALKLSANDASQMIIANNSNFTGSNWESYAAAKNWKRDSFSLNRHSHPNNSNGNREQMATCHTQKE